MGKAFQIDPAGHCPDGRGEPVLGEQIGGQLRRNRDEIGGLELPAQVPPGDGGAAVENGLRSFEIGADVVGHEMVRGHDRDSAPDRLGERIAADDEVRLSMHDIGADAVEEP